MSKRFVVPAALLLLLSSAALAQVQVQGFGLGQTNVVGLLGDGAVGNVAITLAAVDQLATGLGHTTGYQNTVGALTQAAGAVGTTTGLWVNQTGGAVGGQFQVAGTDIQNQYLNADLDQDVYKAPVGAGSALGISSFLGFQNQLSFNPWGGSANVQAVAVDLYDAVGGGPGGTSTVSGGTTIGVGQY